jgi:pyridoxamine 5'-phosphate oxidase
MTTDYSKLRREYRHVGLDESGAHDDPIRQFDDWFRDALSMDIEMANAMVLATAAADGRPAARYVLLKGFDQDGFVFYTHSDSGKGRQLAENPRAALVFYWAPVHRQVRIEGTVRETAAEDADAYFESRPYESRVSVWVAAQSSVVPGREFLDRQFAEFDRRFGGGRVPRPESWRGYRVCPELVEFWQGRENRLHDRLVYTLLPDGKWSRRRLAP